MHEVTLDTTGTAYTFYEIEENKKTKKKNRKKTRKKKKRKKKKKTAVPSRRGCGRQTLGRNEPKKKKKKTPRLVNRVRLRARLRVCLNRIDKRNRKSNSFRFR